MPLPGQVPGDTRHAVKACVVSSLRETGVVIFVPVLIRTSPKTSFGKLWNLKNSGGLTGKYRTVMKTIVLNPLNKNLWG